MRDTIRVIDVPTDATAEQAEELLNAPGDSYFIVQVLPIAGGHRAYLRRYKQTPPTKAEAAKDHVDDATAMSILRANRGEPVRAIVSLLAKAGITRGRQWVCEQLDATCAEDGREEEALAIVKRYPESKPRDIVDELKYARPKIKRSVVWARRKLEEARAAVRPDNS